MASAARLFTRHAFVDLETTGLDPSRDEVIEVGALFVENGEVVGRISRLCRPSAPLPLAIRRLTGIRDEELEGKPPFAELLPLLRDRLHGWTVVAHNAAFEQSFLSGLLADLRSPVLDSCELLHYLYPELESHSLESVVRWANLGHGCAHRALKDCEDTFGVLQYALERCIDEARTDDVADLLATLSPVRAGELPLNDAGAPSPLLDLLERLHCACKRTQADLKLTPSSAFLPERPERTRRHPPPEGGGPVTDAELVSLLGPGGALERTSPGFAARPSQLDMAFRVAKALNEGGQLAVEAATGTGKSLAYLAPAVLYAVKNRRPVAVAPHTRALQDQLVEKDLPKLHRALDGAFGYAVLKGQTNYLCRRRALEVTAVEPGMGHDERAPRAYLRAFLRRSPDGDLDRLSWWFREKYPALAALAEAARSEAATTLERKCPHYARCYYHSAVAHAKEADVLVINQSLALTWPQRYPRVDQMVLDEAHELEDVATDAYSCELTDEELSHLLERLGMDGRRGLARSLERLLPGRGGALVGELRRRVAELGGDAESLADALVALCAKEDGSFTDGASLERRITAEVRTTRPFLRVRDALCAMRRNADALVRLLKGPLVEACPELEKEHPSVDREVAGAVAQLEELSALLDELADRPSDERCHRASVVPAEQLGRRKWAGSSPAPEETSSRFHWTLSSQPIDVSSAFRERFAADKRALVLTSATLSVGPGRPWVLTRLGLDRPDFLRQDTPFDLRHQALVVLVTDAPDPRQAEFVDWASSRIVGLARFMGGRVLGLFDSARRLEEVGERVQRALEPLGIEVLRQWRGQSQKLAARQEQDFGSVLLGTKSFWQGVDIPGKGVGCVFIDKLPIEPAGRALVAAREERLAGTEGYRGFIEYRLPRALILLRQGVGRLIRSASDQGVVVIADPGSPSYRAQLVAALDGYRVVELPWKEARLLVHQSLKAMGLEAARGRASPVAAAAAAP